MKTILLVGCGNIGFRHLQAIAAMPTAADVTIVEPNPAAHDRIHALIAAHPGPHRMQLRTDLPAAGAAPLDLVVVASSADVRRAIVTEVLARQPVKVMILEKVLFQNPADLDAVGALLDRQGVRAFVNCGRRYFPGYQAAQRRWAGARPLDITVTGSAFGLCSNGIHLLDLAEYLNGSAIEAVEGDGLLPGHVAAKRAGCVEVFGTLTARLANGARLTIRCDQAEAMALNVAVRGQGLDVRINEMTRQIDEAGLPPEFAIKHVSECREIYETAVTEGTCGLTPYADSARQHHLFLRALNRHLGQPADALCPIS